MKKHTLSFDMSVYDSINELPETDKKLMLKAVEARNNAYAPYSSFFVGAAVLLENGKIVLGNNQENAAYPSGLCAERVAIYQAAAIYPNVKICSVAISATSKNYKVLEPAAPCGNCRQSMIEYEQKQKEPMTLLLMGEEGTVVKCNSISDILPLAFSNSFL
ncbi:cytidine deaminase [Cellulophaga lytica]|uniref:cytidine deaminase n=1 Tax=Cellulophaga TaxID=104264 RepID=UPI0009509E9F|nr:MULTISPECIES: cytidine deaminase [Cellulophaga]APU10760.1 cytidine deaminase [Cellulophaga lytica]MDO6853378.1 cytidine deaminase [Cellulophaga lytica]TVZ07559.1 cytidine deaminase [Cellulophaga sp. RHA_52]SNQ42161.1 Cytidine deaminase [Cellulophaga lytica]